MVDGQQQQAGDGNDNSPKAEPIPTGGKGLGRNPNENVNPSGRMLGASITNDTTTIDIPIYRDQPFAKPIEPFFATPLNNIRN